MAYPHKRSHSPTGYINKSPPKAHNLATANTWTHTTRQQRVNPPITFLPPCFTTWRCLNYPEGWCKTQPAHAGSSRSTFGRTSASCWQYYPSPIPPLTPPSLAPGPTAHQHRQTTGCSLPSAGASTPLWCMTAALSQSRATTQFALGRASTMRSTTSPVFLPPPPQWCFTTRVCALAPALLQTSTLRSTGIAPAWPRRTTPTAAHSQPRRLILPPWCAPLLRRTERRTADLGEAFGCRATAPAAGHGPHLIGS